MALFARSNKLLNAITSIVDLGMFVEFGAYDGKRFSPTPVLAKWMWRGLYTEPVPEIYRACRDRYASNDSVVVDNVAIGAKNGFLDLHVGNFATTGNDLFRKQTVKTPLLRDIYTGEVISVPMMTLDAFLKKHKVKHIDLLVVDVEGMEWEVFRNFNLDKWRPKMLLVELNNSQEYVKGLTEQYDKTRKKILGGYSVKTETDYDTLFVR